jgi:hypothetical protein
MGKFSSDRTIAEYAREIWQLELPRREQNEGRASGITSVGGTSGP